MSYDYVGVIGPHCDIYMLSKDHNTGYKALIDADPSQTVGISTGIARIILKN